MRRSPLSWGGKPLTRRAPLAPGASLARRTPLKPAGKPRKPQRDTGPSRKVRALVLERDGYQCSRCGKGCGPGIAEYSLQHRKARGVGGDSSASNLILLCGSAVTGCHGHVEARADAHDLAAGYRLESWQEPAMEPVMYFSEHGSGFTAFLADSGELVFERPARNYPICADNGPCTERQFANVRRMREEREAAEAEDSAEGDQ